jgi:hypothetical protein
LVRDTLSPLFAINDWATLDAGTPLERREGVSALSFGAESQDARGAVQFENRLTLEQPRCVISRALTINATTGNGAT